MPQEPGAGAGATGAEEKVKQLEEQLAKLNEASKTREAAYQTLQETYERTNAMVQTMMDHPDRSGSSAGRSSGAGARGGEVDLSDINFEELGIPENAARVLISRTLKEAEKKLDGRVMSLTQMAQQRESFYKKNPDLVGHEFLVGSISQQIQLENPTMSLEKSFEQVAVKTRSYIKGIQDSSSGGGPGVPPIAGAGSNKDGGHPAGQDPVEPDVTPDQELTSEIAERNKLRGRGMNRARSV